MKSIAAYGAYLPYFRLDRKAIGEALGSPASAGTRSVASYDEDTTSMAAEAARAALRAAPDVRPDALYFATTAAAYLAGASPFRSLLNPPRRSLERVSARGLTQPPACLVRSGSTSECGQPVGQISRPIQKSALPIFHREYSHATEAEFGVATDG